MRTLAVINRKGGSGKTTTAVNLAAAIAELHMPVLLVDLDPQGSASDWLEGTGANDQAMFQAIMSTADLARLATPTGVPDLDIIAATPWLVTAERSLLGELSLGVQRAIQGLPRRWAFVIVDCPPSLSYLSVGVLMGVRELVIPVEAHGMALTGADAVIDELPSVRALNPHLATTYLLPCRVTRTNHARSVVRTLETDYPDVVTRTRIRETIKFAEAAEAHQPIMTYAPRSVGTADYRAFAREILGLDIPAPGESDGERSTEERPGWLRHLVSRAGATR
ncbi:MAG TPA: ParA family protein [Candidatus Limnocylindrales bacterium]|nr:ParA family protein [Candidatus Limnocylindrales bacterium]